MPDTKPEVKRLVECNVTIAQPQGQLVVKHPVAIFDTHAEAEDWIAEALRCGRRTHDLQYQEPERFNKFMAPPPQLAIPGDGPVATEERQKQAMVLQLWKMAQAAKLNPYDPQVVLLLERTAGVGQLQVGYAIHELPYQPDPPDDIWQDIDGDPAQETLPLKALGDQPAPPTEIDG